MGELLGTRRCSAVFGLHDYPTENGIILLNKETKCQAQSKKELYGKLNHMAVIIGWDYHEDLQKNYWIV